MSHSQRTLFVGSLFTAIVVVIAWSVVQLLWPEWEKYKAARQLGQAVMDKSDLKLINHGGMFIPDSPVVLDQEAIQGRLNAVRQLDASCCAAKSLTRLVTDPDPDVRWIAAYVLGELGASGDEPIAALAAALSDADNYLRYVAADALRKLGPHARPAWEALVEAAHNDSDPVVRELSQQAAFQIDPERSQSIKWPESPPEPPSLLFL